MIETEQAVKVGDSTELPAAPAVTSTFIENIGRRKFYQQDLDAQSFTKFHIEAKRKE